jgi:hypothetical protein
MADFKVGEAKVAKIVKALDRGKIFVLHFEGMTKPVILSQRLAHKDGYVHRTQFNGVTATVTVTEDSNNAANPAFIGDVDLPLANVSTNGLLAQRQNTANNYLTAVLYKEQAMQDA